MHNLDILYGYSKNVIKVVVPINIVKAAAEVIYLAINKTMLGRKQESAIK